MQLKQLLVFIAFSIFFLCPEENDITSLISLKEYRAASSNSLLDKIAVWVVNAAGNLSLNNITE